VPSLVDNLRDLPQSIDFDDTNISSRPISTLAGAADRSSAKATAVSASILEASVDETPEPVEALALKQISSPSLLPPSLAGATGESTRQSPKKGGNAMLKTASQFGEHAEAAQPRRDVHLLQQQQRGFYNRRLQQNQLLGHSFPAGFSLQVARRDVGAFDFAADTRPYEVRQRATSPPQPASPPPAAAASLLFPSQLSKHPAAAETLAGPFVDLGVYGGPVSSGPLHAPAARRPDRLASSQSLAGSFNVSQSLHGASAASSGKTRPAKAPRSAAGPVKGTFAYSAALNKTRVSAIAASHTGASYTSWMRGAAYDGGDAASDDDDDEASDPYADCAGPTLTMLRRLRQQQGAQLPTATSGGGGGGGWALTGHRVSLTIPTQPAAGPAALASHRSGGGAADARSVFSESLSSAAASRVSSLHNGSQDAQSPPPPQGAEPPGAAAGDAAEQRRQRLPRVYHAPALLPALHPTSLPAGVAATAHQLLHWPSSPPSSAPPDTAAATLLGGLGAPQPQPPQPQTPAASGVVDYATWVAAQRAEREAHEAWRRRGNDPDGRYSLYRGVLYGGPSAVGEKVAWLVEHGVEPGLRPQLLHELLLRPQGALPDHVALCLFSAAQMLKAAPAPAASAAAAASPVADRDGGGGGDEAVAVRPGTLVFGADSVASVATVRDVFAAEAAAEAHVFVPQGADDADADAASQQSHRSLQSLFSAADSDGDAPGDAAAAAAADAAAAPRRRSSRKRHGSVSAGELMAAQRPPPPAAMSDSLSGATATLTAPAAVAAPAAAAAGAWLSEGVQRLVPTTTSLRYLREVVVHDIAEAILCAFPSYHHELLRHRHAARAFSAVDLQHQRQLARGVEDEYFRLARDLAQGLRLQVFDHRDATWRWLRGDADWQRGLHNALLYPAAPAAAQPPRVEVMYHLPPEIEAQLRRHLLLHRHRHRHEARRAQSALLLAQAAVSGVLQGLGDGSGDGADAAAAVAAASVEQQLTASRHLHDSLAALTATLERRDADARHRRSGAHVLPRGGGGGGGGASASVPPTHASLASSALSSQASLGSGAGRETQATGASAANPLLLPQRRPARALAAQSLGDGDASQRAARTPPLTVAKAPSLLYPPARHFAVQALKRHNDDALPKLQAMAASLEQRLLLTRWG
jgi:hypothetical protein